MFRRHAARHSGNLVTLTRGPIHWSGPASSAPEPTPAMAPRNELPLGQILLDDGVIGAGDLLKATMLRQRQDARLGEILLAHGWVEERALTRALSRQWRTSVLDPRETPPDPRLIDAAGAEFCLSHGILPWRRVGGVTWVATARPEAFAALIPLLPPSFGIVRMLLASPTDVQEAVLGFRRTALIRQAESRVAAEESCRGRPAGRALRIVLALGAVLGALLWAAPLMVMGFIGALAILALVAGAGLKAVTFAAAIRDDRDRAAARSETGAREMDAPLPLMSVMVPLFKETEIATKLIARLERLTYPRELTDVLLVVEATDALTCEALKGVRLPRWIRVVKVPDGPIRTKPRALNYALNFCRGEIIGVWDAEDRPDPDQLHRVARAFHFAAPDVACLQGALDFYNPRTNWLARCFTIEYAALFRVMLRGYQRLRLVIPLGGTTIFFRRAALEQVGAWDAWNVTEDADLGVRLARHGFRTEVIDTTTDEEANCRPVPWVKQRSRWLKGYALTWAVAMRDPVGLWGQIGGRAFVAMQVQLLGTVGSYLLAPMLWSFWLLALGLPHPLRDMLGGAGVTALVGVFLAAEALNIAIGLYAVRGTKHRHLLAWVPTMHLYHPLGCFAAWKAIYEVVTRPFYWDKTTHGVFAAQLPGEEIASVVTGPAVFLEGSLALPVMGTIGGRSMAEVAEDRGEPVREVAVPEVEAVDRPAAVG